MDFFCHPLEFTPTEYGFYHAVEFRVLFRVFLDERRKENFEVFPAIDFPREIALRGVPAAHGAERCESIGHRWSPKNCLFVNDLAWRAFVNIGIG